MTVQATRMVVVGYRANEEVAPAPRPRAQDARSVTVPAPASPRHARQERPRLRRAPRIALVVLTLAVLGFLAAGGGAVLGRLADDTGVRMARSSSMSDLAMLSHAEVRDALAHRYYRPLGPTEIEAATEGPRFDGLPALGDPGTRYLSRADLIGLSRGRGTDVPVVAAAPAASLVAVGDVRAGVVTPHVLAGDAGTQVRDLAADLGRRGAQVLVFDLRGVSGDRTVGAPVGGVPDLTAAVDAASAVLPPQTAVAERDGAGPTDPDVRSTTREPSLPGVPVAVLVDHDTAGPAEVLAGALRDARHTPVVGARTAGDAMAREEVPLSDGGALVLAVAEYRTPSGAVLDRSGLEPDVAVVAGPAGGPDAALSAAVAAAR